MSEIPSSFTPKSCFSSRMSVARERSPSEKASSGSVCGTSQPAAIQRSTASRSTETLTTNSCTEIMSGLQMLAGILALAARPAAHELLERRVGLRGEHDLERHVLIPGAAFRARHAFAFQPQ